LAFGAAISVPQTRLAVPTGNVLAGFAYRLRGAL
jgi:hypothetical protein